jgi:hypothetical protein
MPVLQVEAAAQRRNLSLGWNVDKLSCLGTRRTFNETLQEIKAWRWRLEAQAGPPTCMAPRLPTWPMLPVLDLA